jgi:hypothetical protein
LGHALNELALCLNFEIDSLYQWIKDREFERAVTLYTHVSMTEELDIGEETVDSPPDLVRRFSETYQDLAKSSTEHLLTTPVTALPTGKE